MISKKSNISDLGKYNNHETINFDVIYHNYFNKLYQFAFHIILNDDAKDIVQDVFMTIYKQDIVFKTEYELQAYLYKTTKNKCINYLRHIQIVDKHQTGVIDAIMQWNDNNTEEDERLKKFYEYCMSQLSDQQRSIISLKAEGKSYQEIAEILNISIGTVNTHVSRAFKIFRKNFTYLLLFPNFIPIF
ncbi:MAG: RNA polymerase sigma factor [Marinifilaceae bacterium]